MTTTLSPDAALALLKEGNRRFLAGEPYIPVMDRRVREHYRGDMRLAAVQPRHAQRSLPRG